MDLTTWRERFFGGDSVPLEVTAHHPGAMTFGLSGQTLDEEELDAKLEADMEAGLTWDVPTLLLYLPEKELPDLGGLPGIEELRDIFDHLPMYDFERAEGVCAPASLPTGEALLFNLSLWGSDDENAVAYAVAMALEGGLLFAFAGYQIAFSDLGGDPPSMQEARGRTLRLAGLSAWPGGGHDIDSYLRW